MKCPSCGAESQGKFCEYCGSEMPQEKPQVGGCPKCGSSNVSFKRERVGTSTQRSSRKNIIGTGRTGQSVSQSAYRTVGLCQNCGYTWNPNAASNGSGKKTWLWVLGWICIFPVPLTILMLRKKDMKPAVKYGIIAAAWLLFLIIGLSGNSEGDVTPIDPTSPTGSTQIEQTTSTTEGSQTEATNTTTDATTDTTTYPMQIAAVDYSGPECWLLSEPTSTTTEKVLDVYANIDKSSDGWNDQVKIVFTLLWSQYSSDKDVVFKIYNGTDGLNKTQPTYEDLIALWQNKPFSALTESEPTITWYPNGAGVAAQQETEVWNPEG